MDEENFDNDAFSFTKIILKLGTIEKILRQVKAVFKSVDHGNKGHVTKDELKEGLHKAHVDLGEEWEDTNIDDCLQHLQGRAQDHDKVGLREFVVMLAVGRVCRPLIRRSTVFAPLPPQEGKENGAAPAAGVGAGTGARAGAGAGAGARKGGFQLDGLKGKTITEHEVRRPSTTVKTHFTLEAEAAAAAAEFAADEAAEEEAAAAALTAAAAAVAAVSVSPSLAAAGQDPLGLEHKNSSSGNVSRSADPEAQEVADPVTGKSATSRDAYEETDSGGTGATAAAAATQPACEGEPRMARAESGGLSRGTSWRNIRWAKIPPVKSIESSMRGISRSFSRPSSVSFSKAGSGRSNNSSEMDVSMSVKYVLDLFISAYFQFDSEGRGFITKRTLEKKLLQVEREPGASGLLDQKRWSEAAWEGDRLSFQEFIYAFAQWLGLLEDDDGDDESYEHETRPTKAPATTAVAHPAAS
ncbi:unnamed protein product [Pylaiella littoralis]